MEALTLLRSANPFQGFHYLREHNAYLDSLPEEVVKAIVDCLSAENPSIRAEAYNVLRNYPQINTRLYIEDIVHAAFAELANADHPDPLTAALDFLAGLPDDTLFRSVGTKEGMVSLSIPESFAENSALNRSAYQGVSKILVRLWMLIDEDIEQFTAIESTSDARRLAEDISDHILEFYGKVSHRIASLRGSVADDCAIISRLLTAYASFLGKHDMERLVSALLGLMEPSYSVSSESSPGFRKKMSRLSMLLRYCITGYFPRPLVLMNHWKQDDASNYHLRNLISYTLVSILHGLPTRGSYQLLTKPVAAGFLEVAHNEALGSCVGEETSSLDLYSLCADWMQSFLVPSLQRATNIYDAAQICKQILTFFSFALPVTHREQVINACPIYSFYQHYFYMTY